VADVEVGLCTIIGDEDFAVLKRVHGARIDVEIWVELLHCNVQTACGEKVTETRGCEALTERRYDASGNENVLGYDRLRVIHHGVLV
jgi:hypothetical protein